MRTRAAIATLAAIAVGAAAPLAGAHTAHFFTETHITETSGYDRDTGLYAYFAGNVESDSPLCQKGRTVQLRDETGKVIATTTSKGGGHGNWRFDASAALTLAHGHSYYVTVPKRVLKDTPRHLHVCQFGRSPKRGF